MQKTSESNLHFLKELPDVAQLNEDLQNCSAHTGEISFLCYDIYSLRKINRAYGRRVGDALLAAVAKWACGFPSGKLYRIEGDQFCVAFQGIGVAAVRHYANYMESRFGKVWQLEAEDKRYEIFAMATIAVLGDLNCDYCTDLLDMLEQALELSRKEQQITVFTAEYDHMTREHARLQMELRNCILTDMQGFNVHYQPVADPVTGTWRGLEALCRWTGPTIGAVPPGIFIEETEEMGLIHILGVWVLDMALKTCKALSLDKLDRFFVAVNVSAMQVNRGNYVRTVLDALERHHYPAEKLLLEITESTQFSFNEATMASIEALRAKGVMLALDDFGSGYSGFTNLKNLPVDLLKTDREFIENIENDTYLQYFYYIMSETAHANKMQLIAEGIETPEQLRSVVKNGADLVQGYLFGRPMDSQSIAVRRDHFTTPLKEFTGWISSFTDFKQWIYSRDAYKITPSLFGLQSKCIRIIIDEKNLDIAMDKILEMVGVHFKVNRSYVFLRDEGRIFSNRYEWCAEGVEPQKHLFQQVDAREDGFYEVLSESEVVIANNASQLPKNLRDRLEAAGRLGSVQALLVMPMKKQEEILGFVGFDHGAERDWMPEELIILNNLCLLCLAKIDDI